VQLQRDVPADSSGRGNRTARVVRRACWGLLAGASGATALNAATYSDMAIRGRPSSDAERRTAERLAESMGVPVPGRSAEVRNNRLDGAGAVAGIAVGALVGVVGELINTAGWRAPILVEALVLGGLAMAATDGSMAALGVADPRSWTKADWLSDAVPHLAFGLATAAALRATSRRPAPISQS
jgi:hypothetical protein